MSDSTPQIDLPPIKFEAAGDSAEAKQANLDAVLPSPGYEAAALLIADAMTKRADLLVLDFSIQAVNTRLQIDGLWHELPARDRTSGDYMLASLKKLADLNYMERRARQEGEFTAELMNKKIKFDFISQGVPTGERVVIHVNRKQPPTDTLADLGMRQKMIDEVKQQLNKTKGLILVSTLPGDGHTTFWRAMLDAFDRFLRDFYSVQDVTHEEQEVININPLTFDQTQGQSAKDIVPDLLLREPDVLVFPDLSSGEMVDYYCDLALEEEKLVVTRIPAKSSVEAILRVMALKPSLSKFAAALQCVTYQRTIRRLCSKCKQPFQPAPQLVQQLGLPQGRVEKLFNHSEPPPPELAVDENGRPIEIRICNQCCGIGFHERTGIFEYLNVTEGFRQAMTSTSDFQALLNVAVKEGHLTLREEGVVLVAKGITSVQELQRVLQK